MAQIHLNSFVFQVFVSYFGMPCKWLGVMVREGVEMARNRWQDRISTRTYRFWLLQRQLGCRYIEAHVLLSCMEVGGTVDFHERVSVIPSVRVVCYCLRVEGKRPKSRSRLRCPVLARVTVRICMSWDHKM